MASRSNLKLCGLALLLLAVSVRAGDDAKPEIQGNFDLAVELSQCNICHGPDGVSINPKVPTVAGLSEETFMDAMLAYQEGKRSSAVEMSEIARAYTPEQLADMAEFYARQDFEPANQTADQDLAEKGRWLHLNYCEKCHVNQGRTDTRGVSILAGQWIPYLRLTMREYHQGKRDMPLKMEERLDSMVNSHGEESLEQVVQYYGSLR